MKVKTDKRRSEYISNWEHVERCSGNRSYSLDSVGPGRGIFHGTRPDLLSSVPLKIQSKFVRMKFPY